MLKHAAIFLCISVVTNCEVVQIVILEKARPKAPDVFKSLVLSQHSCKPLIVSAANMQPANQVQVVLSNSLLLTANASSSRAVTVLQYLTVNISDLDSVHNDKHNLEQVLLKAVSDTNNTFLVDGHPVTCMVKLDCA
ncbi:hypothetical protein C8R45DRAFT_947581 [Mycena sanguinolenta]|nr:hypothetical protein C8R45DRAFT_947581 [Mycena sanguinolenta]